MSKATQKDETNLDVSLKRKGYDKLIRIPIKIETPSPRLQKPAWLHIRLSNDDKVAQLKQKLRANQLTTVCEEASCPNLSECFGKGTATFMIMGDKCTRRCSFCDVGQGKPDPLNAEEPLKLAQTVLDLGLKYVVITSVDRDDLPDGGASHFAACIAQIRSLSPKVHIEILVPDFRRRVEKALIALSNNLPDIFNHNIETAPRLYKQARPGSRYKGSLELLRDFKARFPLIPTKSGMMLGLGETDAEVLQVMQDLRDHQVEMLTLGQYLQPSPYHMPVDRYVHPDQFAYFAQLGKEMGFSNVASGPLVRSSYHAEKQAENQLENRVFHDHIKD